MDCDHREALRLVLELETALDSGAAQSALLVKLDVALQAIESGMAREEALLKQYGYPGFRFHKREHEDLLRILLQFRAKVADGSATICLSAIEFLGGWLTSHFCGEDQCAGRFLLQPTKLR